MTATRQPSLYKKHLACSICMDIFVDPRALPCLHTFCLQCLHSYVMSVTSTGSGCERDGFECPVCRIFTTSPLHGLCPYSWAENYPPNYAVRDLVEETLKQGTGRKDENGGKCRIPQVVDSKKKTAYKDKKEYKTDGSRRMGFYCSLHNQPFCSSCERIDNRDERHQVEESKTRVHRSLSRLGRSTSGDYEHQDYPPVGPEVLTQEFAAARAIESMDHPGTPVEDCNSELLPHTSLKRLYSEDNDIKQPLETTLPVSGELGDVMPVPVQQRLITNRSTQDDQQLLSDDLRDFLSIHIPNHSQGNPVGHLNDIKEEDEDAKQTVLRPVSRSQDKIYVRIRSDDRCCSVTGLTTLPDGRVIIADDHNKNVKMFDSAGIYLNHISFKSSPFDIDSIEQCEAAVTFPNQTCLRVLLITNDLTVVRTIAFDKKCHGVSYRNRKFFVALDSEIRVLSYEGDLIQRYYRDPSKRKMFTASKSLFLEACYVAVDERHIHVSDVGKRCLVSLNYKGEVVSSFREGEYVKMLGLCRGPGRKLFVCQWPNTLFLLTVSEEGSHIRNVLVSENIQAVHYDQNSQKLWVTQATDNFINQYSFKQNQFT